MPPLQITAGPTDLNINIRKVSPLLYLVVPLLLDSIGLPGASTEESLGMCDFSLQSAQSRPAKVGDKLTTRNFGTGTRGFAAPNDPTTAVCVLPGTELAFSQEATVVTPGIFTSGELGIGQSLAVFRQVNKDLPRTHHDALEFPDGRVVLLTLLCDGQEATVLQLPGPPTTMAEEEEQRRVAYAG